MTPRAKFALLVAFLIAIAVAPPVLLVMAAGALLVATLVARAPLHRLLLRAAAVLPFSGLLALAAWFSGDTGHAFHLLVRSYVSVYAGVLFSATTTIPEWTAALSSMHVPMPLVLTLQFLHRYLWVITDEARRMRIAARGRGGFRFDAATGAIGVLFARSWRRSEMVHRAMVARGFSGRFL